MSDLFHHEAGEGDDVEAGESLGVTLIVFDKAAEAVAHANDRSTTQRRGRRTKPRLASGSLITSSVMPCMAAA